MSCTSKLSGTTGPNGRVTFTVCPTSTGSWRADGVNIVASKPLRVPVKPAPTNVAAGAAHSCARVQDGTVRCWGSNGNGQLGDGTVTASTRPVTVTGLTRVSSVAAGTSFSCAVVTFGLSAKVRCWGANDNGQLGDGTLTQRTTSVQVMVSSTSPLSGVSRVVTGNNFACAVVSPGATGKVYCWGANTYGQLGDGTVTRRTRAVPVKANSTTELTGVTAVSAGHSSACAVLVSGTVRCWGLNDVGQLGNATTTNSAYPVAVVDIDGVYVKATTVAVGNGFGCVRLTSGNVRCWGRNVIGQLGNGTATNSSRPVAVLTAAGTALTGATDVFTGGSHACALIGSGSTSSLRCWGNNASGQIGDGTVTPRRFATLLSTALTGTSIVATGGNHTVAVIPSATRPPTIATSWGLNSSGQIGIGNLTNRTSPTTITTM